MKYCLVILDGLADYPHIRTKNLTPLEVARTKDLDKISQTGRMGLIKSIPEGLPCESLVSVMSILGIDPEMYYTGKAAFEALHMKIPLQDNQWIFSCNLISTFEGALVDHRAGVIRTAEAQVLINDLNQHFEKKPVKFYLGESYRHLMILEADIQNLMIKDPFQIQGQPLKDNYPKGKGAEILIDILEESQKFLYDHDINKIRRELGENPADAIWLWAGGKKLDLPNFSELYRMKAGMIASSPEILGFAEASQIKTLSVAEKKTYNRADYKSEIELFKQAIQTLDLVCIYIKTPLEVSRYGDISEKVRVIEQINDRLILPLQEEIMNQGRLAVVGGHFISIQDRKETSTPVPFAICGRDIPGATNLAFNEKLAGKVNLLLSPGCQFMDFLRLNVK